MQAKQTHQVPVALAVKQSVAHSNDLGAVDFDKIDIVHLADEVVKV